MIVVKRPLPPPDPELRAALVRVLATKRAPKYLRRAAETWLGRTT